MLWLEQEPHNKNIESNSIVYDNFKTRLIMKYDFIIIGSGIVGLATAYSVMNKYPKSKIAILEKKNLFQCINLVIIVMLSTRNLL